MCRCVGDIGRTVLGEFLPQNRNDFLAEEVELFQHCLLGQSGVVDEEQLTLIVAAHSRKLRVRSMTCWGDPTVSGVCVEKSSRLGPWP